MLSEVLEESGFHFAGRLEPVFALDPVKAGKEMERLVDETVTLVEAAARRVVNTESAGRQLGTGGSPANGTRQRREQAPGTDFRARSATPCAAGPR